MRETQMRETQKHPAEHTGRFAYAIEGLKFLLTAALTVAFALGYSSGWKCRCLGPSLGVLFRCCFLAHDGSIVSGFFLGWVPVP